MNRGSGRSRNRTRPAPSGGMSESEVEERKRKVRELEEQLQEKTRHLTEQQRSLKAKGVNVDLNNDSYSSPSDYMSPIRIGIQDDQSRSFSSSPIRVSSVDSYNNSTPPQFAYNFPPVSGYAYEPPRSDCNIQFRFEHPPGYQNFDRQPPPFYHDEQDVRVDEMPKWPMQDSPRSVNNDNVERSFSPTPTWRHAQDVQVDPMPVFPMDDEEKEDSIHQRRDAKARIQMQMIARLAGQADVESKREVERNRSQDDERSNQRKARHDIERIREQVIQEKRHEDRKKDQERRTLERNKRHAEQRKKEEAEAAKRRDAQRRHEDFTRQAEACEYFLQYLIPAIGKLDCKSTRMEGKSPAEYITKCSAVNIPAELLYGSKSAEIKGDSYKMAIVNYVDKLVGLGVVDSKTIRLLKRFEKFPKFLAELVEPLCNDIAIFGTQISVTDERDIRGKFEAFAKEKSAEFWKVKEHTQKLDSFLRRYDQKRNATRSKSRDQKRSRRRSASKERKTPPRTSVEDSLKQLFASTGAPAASQNFNQYSTMNSNPIFMQQPPGIQHPIAPPGIQAFAMMPTPSIPPLMQPFPSHPQFNMNGYAPYQQSMVHPMMQQMPTQPVFPIVSQPSATSAPPRYRTSQEDEEALLDEIYS